MSARFGIIDLFAGPGGLAEGFSSVQTANGHKPFKVVVSVEKEEPAHSTLLLRSFLRQFPSAFPDEYYDYLNGLRDEPDWKSLYPKQWYAAQNEALRLTLGAPEATEVLDRRLDAVREEYGDNTVLIGGPPCQAYSLVGRARNRGIAGYSAEKDNRHFLYLEYIRILNRLKPAAFLMENVKGILSSSVNGGPIFHLVLRDLEEAGDGYKLIALTPRTNSEAHPLLSNFEPSDFIIRAEEHGVPQARHRVIIVGISKKIAKRLEQCAVLPIMSLPKQPSSTLEHVLDGMPRLRSGISRSDSLDVWKRAYRRAATKLLSISKPLSNRDPAPFHERVRAYLKELELHSHLGRNTSTPVGIGDGCAPLLKKWLLDPKLKSLPNSQTRGHMESDIARYLYCSIYAEVTGFSPKAIDVPLDLAPNHRNWTSGKFSDRFRVQIKGKQSATVTSHISKDGHYFIHPDPAQCRSLTVREAARLQTFPDNYLFKGNRTEQYVQVGNAVPPYLAKQIAETVFEILKHSCEHDDIYK